MPFVENDGVRIQYLEEGSGAPLVFLHGFSIPLTMFEELGYIDAFKADYRVIVIESRGHGDSGKPAGVESYRIEARVSDVLAVMDHLGIERTILMGVSLGAQTALAIANIAPERVTAMAICSMHPYSFANDEMRQGILVALRQGMEAFVTATERRNGVPTPIARREYLLRQDSAALSDLFEAALKIGDLSEKLKGFHVPTLVYSGSEDVTIHDLARKAAELMPMAQFVSMEGLNHVGPFVRTDLAIPMLREFFDAHR